MTPPVVDPTSVQAKLRLLGELVDDLDSIGSVDAARLRSQRVLLRAVERILTQVVDVAASAAAHVAGASLAVRSSSYRGAFTDAASIGLIDASLASSLAAAAGMRNLLVHEYARVDLELVAAAVPRARADAQEFIRQVSRWLAERATAEGTDRP